MAKKRTGRTPGSTGAAASVAKASTSGPSRPARSPGRADPSALAVRKRQNRMIAAAGVAIVAVLAVVVGWGVLSRPGGGVTMGAGGAAMASEGSTIQANGGHWTSVSPDLLAAMLQKKDFTLLNVKTPYIGEIDGTDLYIPYTQLTARATELPTDRSAPIVVYCRTGNESAIAAQTLLDMGYTDIVNLDGGMTAWTASGRQIIDRGRG